MALTSGFFNSINNDRRYNAEQISSMFDGMITDGVYQSLGGGMKVAVAYGRTVTVAVGRAWFDNIWIYNDAPMPFELTASEVLTHRYTAIILEINKSDDVRTASIKMVDGAAASAPLKPNLIKNAFVKQYPLAYIYVPAGSSEVKAENIQNCVGTAECPWAGLVNQKAWIDAEEKLFTAFMTTSKNSFDNMQATKSSGFDTMQSNKSKGFDTMQSGKSSGFDTMQNTKSSGFEQWLAATKKEFSDWFAGAKNTVDGEAVSKLATRVGTVETSMTNLNTSMTNFQSSVNTKVGAAENRIGALEGTTITRTLGMGATELSITNSAIKTTSTFDFYTSVYGVAPTNVTVSNGSMLLTFDAQDTAIDVKVVIK